MFKRECVSDGVDGRTEKLLACCLNAKMLLHIPVPPFNEAYPTGAAFCLGIKAPAKAARGDSAVKAKVENFMVVQERLSEVVVRVVLCF